MTLVINNTVGGAFGLPVTYLGYTALAISALFGLLVFKSDVTWWQKWVFWVLNSLIIFCVAMGSNTTVRQIQTAAPRTALYILSAPAFAQSTDTSQAIQGVQGITKTPNLTSQQKLDAIQEQLRAAGQTDLPAQGNSFFKQWKF